MLSQPIIELISGGILPGAISCQPLRGVTVCQLQHKHRVEAAKVATVECLKRMMIHGMTKPKLSGRDCSNYDPSAFCAPVWLESQVSDGGSLLCCPSDQRYILGP
jgi:hypothetical protein